MKTSNPRMKSVMKHDFSKIPHADIQRSTFNRSHGVKTMLDSGMLIPILTDEMVPGDTFKCSLSAVARLSTPLLPFMDNIYIDYHAFFIPNRLVWDNWTKMMGEKINPGDSIDYTVPTVTANFTEDELYDYFGIPTGHAGLEINNLHGRCYNLCWNDWFRDENLQDSVTVDKGDGPDNVADYVLLPRNKRHDYFTSCLPWPQKGDNIQLPLGVKARVTHDVNAANDLSVWNTVASQYEKMQASSTYLIRSATASTEADSLYADLENATAASINDIREAFQLQKILEVSARSGTRYPEIIRGFFGVTDPSHAVLQRPEYIGGGTTPIYVQPIANTSEDTTNPQGHLTAVGFGHTKGVGFNYSATEFGCVLMVMSVRADLTYSQGIDRMWSRQTRYDYYVPQLAHLGEQEVLNKELWCDGSANDEDVFGYQERYAEMRHKKSLITSTLRPDHSGSLDVWHLSQDFATLPALNTTFIEEAPPISRIVAVPSEPEIVFDGFFKYHCTRPMPTFGIPGLIDHF